MRIMFKKNCVAEYTGNTWMNRKGKNCVIQEDTHVESERVPVIFEGEDSQVFTYGKNLKVAAKDLIEY